MIIISYDTKYKLNYFLAHFSISSLKKLNNTLKYRKIDILFITDDNSSLIKENRFF